MSDVIITIKKDPTQVHIFFMDTMVLTEVKRNVLVAFFESDG